MRVDRALEKLRLFLAKRGVSSTAAIITGAISANSVQAAPEALAKEVAAQETSAVRTRSQNGQLPCGSVSEWW
jgi:hypothetical protein